MNYEKMWDALISLAKEDEDYQQCLKRIRELEPEYLRIREGLKPEEQTIMEDYITLCGELDDYMTILAYRLGKKTK